jgi:organic radical activating enzyme
LEHIEKAIRALKETGWGGNIGCMGGEPTIHPKFEEICKLFHKYFPRRRCGLFTSGGKRFKTYKALIDKTFGIMCYNEHKVPSYHQPLLVASEEVILDEKYRNELIDNCWLQADWSPAITIRGAFFCEVAATLDLLFGGSGGYDVTTKWWDRNVEEFRDQRDRYCKLCSVAIPMPTLPDNIDYELVSKNNAARLMKTQSKSGLKLQVVDKVFTREDIEKIKADQSYRDPARYDQVKTNTTWYKAPIDNDVKWYVNNLAKKKGERQKNGDRTRMPLGPNIVQRMLLKAHRVVSKTTTLLSKMP